MTFCTVALVPFDFAATRYPRATSIVESIAWVPITSCRRVMPLESSGAEVSIGGVSCSLEP